MLHYAFLAVTPVREWIKYGQIFDYTFIQYLQHLYHLTSEVQVFIAYSMARKWSQDQWHDKYIHKLEKNIDKSKTPCHIWTGSTKLWGDVLYGWFYYTDWHTLTYIDCTEPRAYYIFYNRKYNLQPPCDTTYEGQWEVSHIEGLRVTKAHLSCKPCGINSSTKHCKASGNCTSHNPAS